MSSCWSVRLSVFRMYVHFFLIPNDNLSKCQWIFSKLGVCTYIVDIWFGIANGQISSIFQLSVRETSDFLFPDDNLSKYQWIFNKQVHWYCRDLVWDCWGANFVTFWQSCPPGTWPYFCSQMITWVNVNGFSPNLVWALILWRSGSQLLMGKFRQFLTELSAHDIWYFCFRTITQVNVNEFSSDLICALILWISGLGLQLDTFRQLSTHNTMAGYYHFMFLLFCHVIMWWYLFCLIQAVMNHLWNIYGNLRENTSVPW